MLVVVPQSQRGGPDGSWRIVFTPTAERWIKGLRGDDLNRMTAAFDQLARHGPTLGRPCVDRIKRSRFHNMNELRSVGGHQRALFAFDPQQRAIILIGGDKSNNWKGWYERNIPRADKLYEKHLRSLGKEGRWPTSHGRAGGRSAESSR
jgi:hypothetical protein